MKKILLIGSKGFIGKACEQYFKTGYDITGCDVLNPENENTYFQISSPEDFKKVIASSQFDVCINASGSANVGFSFQNEEMDHDLNVKNLGYIIEAIKNSNPACKVINFSSAAVYGNPAALPVKENFPMQPLSPYGKHKLLSENMMKQAAEQHKVKSCSLRVFSAYGPGLHKQLFWDIFQKTKLGKNVSLFGTGNESRDFIFIDDLVKVVECIINNAEFKGEVYNVASGIETSIKNAALVFLNALGKDFQLQFSGEIKKGDPLNWQADISRLKNLGFNSFTPLETGLTLTADDYKKTITQP